jgi:hypothetical protein
MNTTAHTLDDLLVMFDSDTPGARLDALRIARDLGLRDDMRAVLEARRAAEARTRAADEAFSEFCYRQSLSNVHLQELADSGDPQARQAQILLELPTISDRIAAKGWMHRFLNATPDAGRPSDALRVVVSGMIAGYPA